MAYPPTTMNKERISRSHLPPPTTSDVIAALDLEQAKDFLFLDP